MPSKQKDVFHTLIGIVGLPKTVNAIGRKHWAVKAQEARTWHILVSLALGTNRPSKPLKKAKLVCTRYSVKRPDYDGLVSSFKHVIDGLVVNKVIEDDNWEVIGMPDFLWEKVSKRTEQRITVSVCQV